MMLLALILSAALVTAFPHHDNPSGNTEIIGGTEAEQGEFPFIINIDYCAGSRCSHYCGGSIYNNEWIITAAHCVTKSKYVYQVTSGEHSLSKNDGTEQVRKISQIIMHKYYNRPRLANDIALLKLASPLNYDAFTTSIPIMTRNKVIVNEDALVIGWGSQDDGSNPDVLRYVVVPIISDRKCRQSFPIEDTMMCAGYEKGGKDSCGGDSGGPLITIIQGNKPILTGVVSWGYGCAKPRAYGVYTEVAFYNDWIKLNIAIYS